MLWMQRQKLNCYSITFNRRTRKSQDNVDCLSILAYLTCQSMIQTGNNCKHYVTKWLFHGCLGRPQHALFKHLLLNCELQLLQNLNNFTNILLKSLTKINYSKKIIWFLNILYKLWNLREKSIKCFTFLLTFIILSTAFTYVKFNIFDVVTFSKNTQRYIKQLLHERYPKYIEINLWLKYILYQKNNRIILRQAYSKTYFI